MIFLSGNIAKSTLRSNYDCTVLGDAQPRSETACGLGFRGRLDEWERLMGAVARR